MLTDECASDGGQVIIKSPFRAQKHEQRKAVRQLDSEITILSGPLKNTEGIRQLVDQVVLTEGLDRHSRLGVFEHLDFDLHKYYLTQKNRLSRLEIKSIARQILTALSNTHKQNIVHTDLKPENIVFSWVANSTASEMLVKIIDFGLRNKMKTDIIGSPLMEPGAKLFQTMGGHVCVSIEEQEREFLRSRWTIIPFPKTFLDRAPKKWQDEISSFSPRLAPTGVPITLSFIGENFEGPGSRLGIR
ncbi:putative serine/threonine-protein kinase [Lachnellula subtilissima]|uniref:Autophagy-related protein 1 n=1 Tax=Lachnellula subtilissima TaxID=602034 RepID=A0A8H8RNA8_9HELO|nr:putative serine/threonine-protein kinase [Lachnellula subtilissima]